jgi:glutamyl-tRNA reductase
MQSEINNFCAIGFNYKNLDLNQREEILKNDIEDILNSFLEEQKIKGYIFFCTCLRIEFYIYKNQEFNIHEFLVNLPDESHYVIKGCDAISHLFNVACGLDSIIIGENQVLTQVKNALKKAHENKSTCSEINKIFNNAIAAGKKFRHQSKINKHGLSLERNLYNFISEKIDNLNSKKIFLIGIGDIIKSILYVFKKEKLDNIYLTTKTEHKLRNIKNDFNVNPVNFKDKYKIIEKSDIVITATSAPHYIITKKELEKYNINKKIIFFDMAVPRDIEESIKEFSNVELYNIEDIFNKSKNNLEKRRVKSEEYKYIVDEQVVTCLDWFKRRQSKLCIK